MFKLNILFTFTLFGLYIGTSSLEAAEQCHGPFCLNTRGYIHHKPAENNPYERHPFKEWVIMHTSAYSTTMLLQFHDLQNTEESYKEYFVAVYDNKYQMTKHSYTLMESRNTTILFKDVLAVTITASAQTEFYLDYYVGCMVVEDKLIKSDMELSNALQSSIPRSFIENLCWVVLPNEKNLPTTWNKAESFEDTDKKLNYATFHNIGSKGSLEVLKSLTEQVMNKEESDCIEMEISNTKCLLDIECMEAPVHCSAFDSIDGHVAFMTGGQNPEARIAGVSIPKIHPRRTSRIWWYIFRSGCDNFQHLVLSKKGHGDLQNDKETWLSLIRLSYYCNDRFSCREFGPCTQTCNFVRSIKRLRALIGYDICDPFSDSQRLSMF